MILAGDVGATKILLEVGEVRSGRWKPAFAQRMELDDIAGISQAIGAFLRAWEAVKPPRARITAGAIGVAGPAVRNRVKMTHRPWTVDGDTIAHRFRIPRVDVMNDLALAAHGLELLARNDVMTLQAGKAVAGAPQVILGIGTGLGVAIRTASGEVIATEGGHVGFSPASLEQTDLWRALHAVHGRVEVEQVVSGRGLKSIRDYLRVRGESNEAAALDLFTGCLGNVAGDAALACLARGGVFIAGGVLARIAPSIKKERFRAAFCAKGVFSSLLMRIPVRAITNEKIVLLGAARYANRAV